jgi:hypothetical protein
LQGPFKLDQTKEHMEDHIGPEFWPFVHKHGVTLSYPPTILRI